MNTIVVGVDGTRESFAALRFAMREAQLRGDRLKVVTTWHIPSAAYGGAFTPASPDPADFQRPAEQALAEALAIVTASAHEAPPVEGVLREGDAAHVLVEESAGADQLVVGCHDYGGLRALVHHSVSGRCAHGAHCPVTVVHMH